MELIYNGQSFAYTAAPRHTVTPRAMNWRYQMKGLDCTPTPVEAPARSVNPNAVNWRYQIPGM
jgi:hypothetical protein